MQPLNYPVILENKYGASAFSDQSKLSVCGEEWVDKGKIIGSYIIDETGRVFQVKNVQKIKPKNFLPNWMVPYSRRIVQVDYKLEHIEDLNIEELKFRMCSLFERVKNIHDEGIEEEIQTASTIREVIETIGIE